MTSELFEGDLPVDSPMIGGWHNYLTMDQYADGPPVSFHAWAQPLVNAMWFQWRMTQEPVPTHISFKAFGGQSVISGVVTDDDHRAYKDGPVEADGVVGS